MSAKLIRQDGSEVNIKINGEMELPEEMKAKYPLKKRFFITLLEDVNEALIKGGTFSLNTIEKKSNLTVAI